VAQLAAGTFDTDGLGPTDPVSRDDCTAHVPAPAAVGSERKPTRAMGVPSLAASSTNASSSPVDAASPLSSAALPATSLPIASATCLAVPLPASPAVSASDLSLCDSASTPHALRDHYVCITLLAAGIVRDLVDTVAAAAQAKIMTMPLELCSSAIGTDIAAAAAASTVAGTSGVERPDGECAERRSRDCVSRESPTRSAWSVPVFQPVASHGYAAQGQFLGTPPQAVSSGRQGKTSPARLVQEVAPDAIATRKEPQVTTKPLVRSPCRALVRPNAVAQSKCRAIAASPAHTSATGPVATSQVYPEVGLENSSPQGSGEEAMALPAKLSCRRQFPSVDLGFSPSRGVGAVRIDAAELIVSGQVWEAGASTGLRDPPDLPATGSERHCDCEPKPSQTAALAGSAAASAFSKCAAWRSRDPKHPSETQGRRVAQAVCGCCGASQYDGTSAKKSMWSNVFGRL
jgi:hypothetical protein